MTPFPDMPFIPTGGINPGKEAIRTVRDFAAHEVARVLTGQPPLSPVNAAQLAMVPPRHSA